MCTYILDYIYLIYLISYILYISKHISVCVYIYIYLYIYRHTNICLYGLQ